MAARGGLVGGRRRIRDARLAMGRRIVRDGGGLWELWKCFFWGVVGVFPVARFREMRRLLKGGVGFGM